jgi:hypothetical protein
VARTRPPEDESVLTLFAKTLNDFGCLVSDHVELAWAAFVRDMKFRGRLAAVLVAALVIATIGYIFVCVGLALILAFWTGLAWSLLTVGGFHLLGALVAIHASMRNLREATWMSDTTVEANETVAAVTASFASSCVIAATPLTEGCRSGLRTPKENRQSEPQIVALSAELHHKHSP